MMEADNYIYYKKYTPCAELAHHIQFFYHFKSQIKSPQRILPLGTTEVVITLEPVSAGNGFFYSNLVTRYSIIQPESVGDIIGISFHPWGFKSLFGVNGFANRKLPLQEVLPQSLIGALANSYHGLSAIDDIVNAIQGFLLRQKTKPVHAVLRQSVAAIHAAKGTIQPRELRPLLAISERRLEQLFVEYLGTSPRQYSQLKKFHAAIAQLDSHASLTHAALQANYYDQSHFIRQFKAFAGISPRVFLRENQLLNNINKADYF